MSRFQADSERGRAYTLEGLCKSVSRLSGGGNYLLKDQLRPVVKP